MPGSVDGFDSVEVKKYERKSCHFLMVLFLAAVHHLEGSLG